MKRLTRLAGGVALAALAACETTGDPRAGGLFGWSEHQARERQTTRQAAVAGAASKLSDENNRSTAMEARGSRAEAQLATADKRHRQDLERLRTQRNALVAKCDQLEAASPTAATASRARALRRNVNTAAANSDLSPHKRGVDLRQIETEIDAALARVR